MEDSAKGDRGPNLPAPPARHGTPISRRASSRPSTPCAAKSEEAGILRTNLSTESSAFVVRVAAAGRGEMRSGGTVNWPKSDHSSADQRGLMSDVVSLENFRLTVFRKVAEQLSFRRAAEELYLTQPAVSLQIKTLEEELGMALFDRSGSQVKLTPAGQTLLTYAEESNNLLHKAMQSLFEFGGMHGGALTLGASTTIAQYVLPRLLSKFCATHPRLRPTLVSGNTENVVEAVEQERIALGFIEGPPRARNLTSLPFLEDELVLLVPASHEFAERATVDPFEVTAAPLLMRERGSGTRQIIEMALERQHHIRRSALNVVMELDSTEAIKSAVEAGLGIGFVSRWALAKDARTGTSFRAVEVDGLRLRRHFIMVHRNRPDLSGPAAEFRAFVLANTKPRRAGGATKLDGTRRIS